MKIRKSSILLAVVAAVVLAVSPLQAVAGFTLIDDFESYSVGLLRDEVTGATVSEGGIWEPINATTSGAGIALDGANHYLATGVPGGGNIRGAYGNVPAIADGSSAMYYFQIWTSDATPNNSWGLSDIAAPTNFPDFEVQIILNGNTNGGTGLFDLRGRNGALTDVLQSGLTANTWYDVWIDVDNATDTYDVYFGTSGDPNVLGALVGSNLAFRNGTSDSLITFVSLGFEHDLRAAGTDNLYRYEQDVVVPEPASVALAIGSVALLACFPSRSIVRTCSSLRVGQISRQLT